MFIKLEPKEPGSGYEFVNEISGGVIPKEYIPAVDKGIQEAMQNGVLAGYRWWILKLPFMMGATMMWILQKWRLKSLALWRLKKRVALANPRY